MAKSKKELFSDKIIVNLTKAGKKGIFVKELGDRCRVKANDKNQFKKEISDLIHIGKIVSFKGKIFSSKALGVFSAKVERLNKTFGFVRREDNEEEVFVAGKFLKGAMVGDTVLVKPLKTAKDSPEGEVLSIIEEGFSTFTGVIVKDGVLISVIPDQFAKFPIMLRSNDEIDYKVGDKVLAKLTYRGNSHRDHKAEVVEVYGDAQLAATCAQALLEQSNVRMEFPAEAIEEAHKLEKKGISESETASRLDLRAENIFTIDGADSMDLDDAVSISKMGDVYQLSVHIADVSHYVRYGSALDGEAFERGTSVYYANKVVPMLPKELSNGICSLNPNEDRLSFSALLTIDSGGKLLDFDFKKSVICSRVKGVYSEINDILSREESEEIKQKYAGLYDHIFLMKELADKLIKNRVNRGAPEIETTESKIKVIDGVASDIEPRIRGEAERIIEEFMLLANEAAATLAKTQEIPFVYRVHENPTPEKIEGLRKTMGLLGLDTSKLKDGQNPMELAAILRQAEDTPFFVIVNRTVLRSMAKA
ncbi:MAG: ribonuclease, partial [Oscillospiraceae bacterium]|nr:ribonuclease [Oscillospiraceae bacterium]